MTKEPASHAYAKNLAFRRKKARVFKYMCFAASMFGLVFLFCLFYNIFSNGLSYVSWDFITHFPSRFPHKAGIQSAIWGSIWLMGLTAIFSIPVGVGASVYLEEFAPKNTFIKIIEINISNLAGVPSVVYGLLGLAIFVRWIGLGRSIVSGALTMSLLILPIIIIASREAIKTVPDSLRYAALALGATKWQMVRGHVLPSAMPGIMTGIILSISRAIGETAPLLVIGALGFVPFNPKGPMDSFTVLPIQIFNWASRPQIEFHKLAATGIIVLLVVLLMMNSIAIFLRYKFQSRK
ncbi:MAG: phosphate ABC transporter permease PstA [Deltaproteobacteria bacterium]|nr:phosphate ABC transporter permease PstA [Deltaproteobacteria bacterium]